MISWLVDHCHISFTSSHLLVLYPSATVGWCQLPWWYCVSHPHPSPFSLLGQLSTAQESFSQGIYHKSFCTMISAEMSQSGQLCSWRVEGVMIFKLFTIPPHRGPVLVVPVHRGSPSVHLCRCLEAPIQTALLLRNHSKYVTSLQRWSWLYE